jgi:hypothetical protein
MFFFQLILIVPKNGLHVYLGTNLFAAFCWTALCGAKNFLWWQAICTNAATWITTVLSWWLLPGLFFLNLLFLFIYFLLFYYSYVHTRLGSFLPPAPTPSLTRIKEAKKYMEQIRKVWRHEVWEEIWRIKWKRFKSTIHHACAFSVALQTENTCEIEHI